MMHPVVLQPFCMAMQYGMYLPTKDLHSALHRDLTPTPENRACNTEKSLSLSQTSYVVQSP